MIDWNKLVARACMEGVAKAIDYWNGLGEGDKARLATFPEPARHLVEPPDFTPADAPAYETRATRAFHSKLDRLRKASLT